jgi:hypothetical protein
MIQTQQLKEWGMTWEEYKALVKAAYRQAGEHADRATGEVNCTQLAEALADEFNHPEWLDDDLHVVWTLAVDAALVYEKGD